MGLLTNPGERFWRTDFKLGRNIYALQSNDVQKPSGQDPLVGVMETSELAENVVELHNQAIKVFGNNHLKAMARLSNNE